MIRNHPTETSANPSWPTHQPDGDSHSSDSGAVATKKKRITANSFASILADVMDAPGYEDAIYWSEDGKSFRVIPKTFTEKVLEKHMKGTKFSSFFRRLIRWRFERVVLDEFPMDAFVFRHEMFQRGQASLLRTLSPYHVSRGKRVTSVQKSIVVKAKKANSKKTAKAIPIEIKEPSTSKDSAPDGIVSSSRSNSSIPLLSTQPTGLMPAASLAFASQQRQQQQCTDHEATLALIRRQQELLLLSQLNHHQQQHQQNNSRVGLESLQSSLYPSSLLTQRLADRDLDVLAREMHLRDFLRASNASRLAVPQERSLFFANNNNTEGLLAGSGDPERLALLSMLLRQPQQEVLRPVDTPRYDELFRLVNLMNRLQE